MSDEEYLALMERVIRLTSDIFHDDADIMNEKEFFWLWERNKKHINLKEKAKNAEFGWLVFYQHYLFLNQLDKARRVRLFDELELMKDMKETKVPHLRLVKNCGME